MLDSCGREDASGSFGILPGHAPFLTALAVSIAQLEQAPTGSCGSAPCAAGC